MLYLGMLNSVDKDRKLCNLWKKIERKDGKHRRPGLVIDQFLKLQDVIVKYNVT